MDTERLCRHIFVGKTDGCSFHFLVPLLGKFKREDGDLMHVFFIANETRSGIHIWIWVERLVNIYKAEVKHKCTTFCDEDGFQIYAAVLESVIHPILRRMQGYNHHKDDTNKELEVEY